MESSSFMNQTFRELLEALSAPGGTAAQSVSRSGPGSKARLALALMQAGRHVVMFMRDQTELTEMRALLALFDPASAEAPASAPMWERRVAHFSPHPLRSMQRGGRSGRASWADRIAALYSLKNSSANDVSGRCTLVLPDTLLLRIMPAGIFDRHTLRLYKGMEMSPELIMDQLVEWGYGRAGMVAEPGEFAARGDILDIFCPGYARPVRLEFFGDNIEDLRAFDAGSQRSVGGLEDLTVLPAQGVLPTPALQRAADRRWTELEAEGRLDENDLYMLRKELEAGGRRLLPGVYYDEHSCIEDWLHEDSVFILPGAAELDEAVRAAAESWQAFLAEQEAEGLVQPRSLVLRPESQAASWLLERPRVYFEDLHVGVAEEGAQLAERGVNSFQDMFPHPADLERPWHRLVESMQEWAKSKTESVLLSFASERGRAKFLDLAGQDGINPRRRYEAGQPGLYALVSPFRRGLNLVWDNTLVLGEDVIQPRSSRAQRPAAEAFKGLDRYDELQEGDYLVHRDYGVCAFGGLQHLRLGDVANDFLLLRYAGSDKLYLPVDRLGLIQVFKAPDGVQPALDKLGGSQWTSSKDKAKKAIEKIAGDLVEMYAYRKVAKGYSYGPLSEMYREFEATFGFEETPDQARAIADVLADMEKPEPMDRLVCGDVGFGKTEVAMRAAFRAALEGRQVALLCPTTVLAEQHYQTFRARLSGFPVNVGMLSRFVPRARQNEIVSATARGQVDILIGTHRLLSKDVSIPNLGLIILDEEQRFGVRHKENLKQLKQNVDVLTLTATPIPRTLQLSLSGIRELSVIETPPPERKPVSTALINRDERSLKSVIDRELARQGQIFWVYNRVQGLDRAVEYVRKLAPEARIGMAHGQMGEKALEEAMRAFWHGDLDVLVCTAIIESGLDFPRANTLIVDQAQMFGLGQLYQLRGRVGRSDRQAYAVFVANNVDKLPEISRKRLRIIMDMDYLGAGVQVAMEDLRLRGAGNILGEAQSGHMQRVGLDLFLEMLEEAVAKLRGQPLRESVQTELNLGVAAHIPESYIADSRERLRYYKALSSAGDAAAQREVEFELRDRFGPVPRELANFFGVLNFKRHLADWGVIRADIHENNIRLQFDERQARLDPAVLVAWVQAGKGRARIHPPAVLDYALEGGDLSDRLAAAYEDLLPVVGGAA